MSVARFLAHLFTFDWRARRRFSATALDAIEQEVAACESRHGGQIRFAVEPALRGAALWWNIAPRTRAVEIFSRLGVWDTELNNGVLIYVLLADRDVEIVADRAFNTRVTAAEWEAVCHLMETEFRAGCFEAGAIAGVRGVSALIERHFPPGTQSDNELPDRPTFL